MPSKQNKNSSELVDPELLDVLLQGISVLSNVATMAATWLAFRGGKQPGQNPSEQINDSLRGALRSLHRNLEDCFESVESALRILMTGTPAAATPGELLKKQPRFGNSVYLQPAEFHRLMNHLNTLENAALNARQTLRMIQSNLQSAGMPNTDHVSFDVDQFNADLNSTLFESPTFEDAIIKLRSLQARSEDFITELSVALRGN